MVTKTHLLHNVWKKSATQISKIDLPFDQTKFDELVNSVFSSGPCYFYIIDFFDMQIKYMSSQIAAIHGTSPETTSFQNILDRIHPDDMEFIVKAETKVFKLMEKLGPERAKKYKYSYCFRLKTKNGSYQLFNHQAMILTADDNGAIGKSLNIHTNISHLACKNNYKISAIGMFGEPSFLNMDYSEDAVIPHSSPPMFSKREIQIVHLLAEGLTSQDIAFKLNIALHTVKNHRKKILQKARCKNLGQLIARCVSEGLI